ncbi:MAG: phosphoadenylyl-sulfate reductase [Cyclobacteriaceae bacterium]
MSANVGFIANSLSALSSQEGLRWISLQFPDTVRFSTSLGLEDQVITHMIGSEKLDIKIFTLDTGRLFQETYDVLDLTQKKYDVSIHAFFPQTSAVEKLITEKGPNSFYDSVENRKECCRIRKIEPLKRALQGATVWITGVRAEQSENRNAMKLVEWDEPHQVIKYNPLLNWTEKEVLAFIELNKVPVNTLHKKGYPSIGCAPCTRAIMPGEDLRAGRWWWESSSKECGLHEHRAVNSK